MQINIKISKLKTLHYIFHCYCRIIVWLTKHMEVDCFSFPRLNATLIGRSYWMQSSYSFKVFLLTCFNQFLEPRELVLIFRYLGTYAITCFIYFSFCFSLCKNQWRVIPATEGKTGCVRERGS